MGESRAIGALHFRASPPAERSSTRSPTPTSPQAHDPRDLLSGRNVLAQLHVHGLEDPVDRAGDAAALLVQSRQLLRGLLSRLLRLDRRPPGGQLVLLLEGIDLVANRLHDRLSLLLELALLGRPALDRLAHAIELGFGELDGLAGQVRSALPALGLDVEPVQLRLEVGDPLRRDLHLLDEVRVVQLHEQLAGLHRGSRQNAPRDPADGGADAGRDVGRVHRLDRAEPDELPLHRHHLRSEDSDRRSRLAVGAGHRHLAGAHEREEHKRRGRQQEERDSHTCCDRDDEVAFAGHEAVMTIGWNTLLRPLFRPEVHYAS
ncbi:MAG: hypothetical protein ACYTGC_20735 [Planctomycetota bacterium]|jgi:hypothetical protein